MEPKVIFDISSLKIKGKILESGSNEYKESLAKRWNGDVVNTPKLIVQPVNNDDIIQAIQFAKENSLNFAVKAGGHGSKSFTDGLFLDLCEMNKVTVDPVSKTARAQAGCVLGDVDRETDKHSLVAPFGHVSHTGLGLVLGGGIGHLSRSLGLSVDNLLEVEIITYFGEVLVANEKENTDIFWAIQGAGTNYGVVTSYLFKLTPISDVLLGTFVYPPPLVKPAFLEIGRLQAANAIPNELSFSISLTPEGAVFLAIYNGPHDIGRPILEEFAKVGSPVVSVIAPTPYLKLQTLIDDKVPHGMKYYQKGPFLNSDFTEEIIDIILESWKAHPTGACSILFTHLGGKVNERKPTDTPYFYRDAKYQIIFLSIILDDAQRDAVKKWTYDSSDKLEKFCYYDYVNTTEAKDIKLVYGDNYERLVELKKKYDPTNFFKANVNIQ